MQIKPAFTGTSIILGRVVPIRWEDGTLSFGNIDNLEAAKGIVAMLEKLPGALGVAAGNAATPPPPVAKSDAPAPAPKTETVTPKPPAAEEPQVDEPVEAAPEEPEEEPKEEPKEEEPKEEKPKTAAKKKTAKKVAAKKATAKKKAAKKTSARAAPKTEGVDEVKPEKAEEPEVDDRQQELPTEEPEPAPKEKPKAKGGGSLDDALADYSDEDAEKIRNASNMRKIVEAFIEIGVADAAELIEKIEPLIPHFEFLTRLDKASNLQRRIEASYELMADA